jgi:hypothetical protein
MVLLKCDLPDSGRGANRAVLWVSPLAFVVCACLPRGSTLLRTPDGGQIELGCDLTEVEDGASAYGCTSVPLRWPLRPDDEIVLRGEAVAVGCIVRLPLREAHGPTPVVAQYRPTPDQTLPSSREVTCVAVWRGWRGLYGWRGLVDGPETVVETAVYE